jgi:hypothetical protein
MAQAEEAREDTVSIPKPEETREVADEVDPLISHILHSRLRD